VSDAVLCDVCGQVDRRADAPRNGWIVVSPMADLADVVPADHPLHGPRHVCSSECFARFAGAVATETPLVSIRPTSAADPVEITSLPAPAAGATELTARRQRGRRGRAPGTKKQGVEVVAAEAPEGGTGHGGRVKLSEIVTAGPRRSGAPAIDLRRIAAKPAPRRRA
jgi:hypothetical protein